MQQREQQLDRVFRGEPGDAERDGGGLANLLVVAGEERQQLVPQLPASTVAPDLGQRNEACRDGVAVARLVEQTNQHFGGAVEVGRGRAHDVARPVGEARIQQGVVGAREPAGPVERFAQPQVGVLAKLPPELPAREVVVERGAAGASAGRNVGGRPARNRVGADGTARSRATGDPTRTTAAVVAGAGLGRSEPGGWGNHIAWTAILTAMGREARGEQGGNTRGSEGRCRVGVHAQRKAKGVPEAAEFAKARGAAPRKQRRLARRTSLAFGDQLGAGLSWSSSCGRPLPAWATRTGHSQQTRGVSITGCRGCPRSCWSACPPTRGS